MVYKTFSKGLLSTQFLLVEYKLDIEMSWTWYGHSGGWSDELEHIEATLLAQLRSTRETTYRRTDTESHD